MNSEITVIYPQQYRDGSGVLRKAFNTEKLAIELSEFQDQIVKIFGKIDESVSKFRLDEIEVSVEISAEGKIGILGTGIQTSATGGISLKFVRQDTSNKTEDLKV